VKSPVKCAPPRPQTATDLLRNRGANVRPDTIPDATLNEVFVNSAGNGVCDGAAVGFVLAHLKTDRPILWVQDRLSRKETGRPYLGGLPQDINLLHVTVSKPTDVLWTMEEALRCASLAGVIGEVWGDPAVVDFTATKRLALRAEAHRVPAWLVRRAAHPNLSAARERWMISSLPSLPNPYDMRAPGQARWATDLFRSRWRQPQAWVAWHDDTGLHLDHGAAQTPGDSAATGSV
jgi:protein ImuA